MTCQQIFDSALHAICEDPADTLANADYLERAPYLLANVFGECASLDNAYRLAHGAETVPPFEGVTVELSDEFPLSPAFASATVYYLAAMLVLDENEALYERLFDLYSDALSRIQATLPAQTHPIVRRYEI